MPGGTTYGQAWPFAVFHVATSTIENAAKANANRSSVFVLMCGAKPDTPYQIRFDANVSAYPDSCGRGVSYLKYI